MKIRLVFNTSERYVQLSLVLRNNSPGFLNKSFSLFLKLFPLKSHNNTQQLILKSLHSHRVVHNHTATKVRGRVLGVGQLCVQVQTETWVIIHFFVSQYNEFAARLA